MWAIIKLVPKFTCTLVAVPRSLVPTLPPEARAELTEAVQSILPVRPRRLGLLNEGNKQGTQIQYPLEQVTTPTLFISAPDDLYNTLPVAQKAARIIPDANLIELPTGGHIVIDSHQFTALRSDTNLLGFSCAAAFAPSFGYPTWRRTCFLPKK